MKEPQFEMRLEFNKRVPELVKCESVNTAKSVIPAVNESLRSLHPAVSATGEYIFTAQKKQVLEQETQRFIE